jgi:peptide/nickel transport system permease protein
MARFITRRLLLIPIALILVNFAGFTYAHYARPLRAARTPYVHSEPAGPLWPAYLGYIETLINRDFGLELDIPGSVRLGPVTLGDTLLKATTASLGLLSLAFGLSLILGFLLGTIAVRNEPPGVARWLTPFSTLGLAMPSFYIGSLAITGAVIYVLWRGSNVKVPLPLNGFGWDAHLILPVLALMARPAVQMAQMTAGLLSTELSKQYIIAARSLGYTWRAIRNRYALRNVIAPVIVAIAGMLRLMVGELVLVEWLFKWPGLGRLLAWTLVPAELSSQRGSPLFLNPPVMAALLTIIAGLFLFSDFFAAILVRIFDPRLRNLEERGEK